MEFGGGEGWALKGVTGECGHLGGNNPLFGDRVRRSMKTAAVCGRFLTLDSVVLLEATA